MYHGTGAPGWSWDGGPKRRESLGRGRWAMGIRALLNTMCNNPQVMLRDLHLFCASSERTGVVPCERGRSMTGEQAYVLTRHLRQHRTPCSVRTRHTFSAMRTRFRLHTMQCRIRALAARGRSSWFQKSGESRISRRVQIVGLHCPFEKETHQSYRWIG